MAKQQTPSTINFIDAFEALNDAALHVATIPILRALYRSWGGIYPRAGMTVDDCKDEVRLIRNEARTKLLAGGLTLNQQIGAILHTSRTRLVNLGRFEGFVDGLGDNPIHDYLNYLAQLGGAAGVGAQGAGIPPVGAGVGPPAEPIDGLAGRVAAAVNVAGAAIAAISARDIMLEHGASVGFQNDLNLTDLNFNPQPGVAVHQSVVEFVDQFTSNVPCNTLKENDLVVVSQFVPPRAHVPTGYEILQEMAYKVYVVNSLVSSLKLTRVGFVCASTAVRNPNVFVEAPEFVELARDTLHGTALVISEGFLRDGVLRKYDEAKRKRELAAVQGGKFIMTRDNVPILVTSNSHKSDATVTLATFTMRVFSREFRSQLSPSGTWASVDFALKCQEKHEQLYSESISNSIHTMFSAEVLSSYGEISYLKLFSKTNQVVAFIKEQIVPPLTEFAGSFDDTMTMQTGRQVVLTMLRNFCHWLVVVLGEQWRGSLDLLIDIIKATKSPETSWGHPQYSLVYFGVAFKDVCSQFFRMLATQPAPAFEKYNNGRVVTFTISQDAAALMNNMLVSDDFKPQSVKNLSYVLGNLVFGGVPSNSNRSSIKRSSSPLPPSQSTSRSSTPSPTRSTSPTTNPRPSTKLKAKKVKFESVTQTKTKLQPCHKHFMYTIGAKASDGSSCSPCTGACNFEHVSVPRDKSGKTAMALKLFGAKQYKDQLFRAKKAIQ